jgi:hypothetical protein
MGVLMKQAIYLEVSDVTTRLEELGLSTQVLHEAIKIGQAHRDACTENDPPSFPGLTAWARTIRSLRELLAPQGWVRSDEHKIPLVLSSSGTVAVAVSTGNADTGNVDMTSKTKYPKGPATVSAVKKNAVQLSFYYAEENIKPLPQRTSNCLTWVLLVSRGSDEIRCELSLPNEIGEDGRVVNWDERIILPPVPIDNENEIIFSEEEGADDIVVEILRRDPQP